MVDLIFFLKLQNTPLPKKGNIWNSYATENGFYVFSAPCFKVSGYMVLMNYLSDGFICICFLCLLKI